jgi:hypothetical protein
VSRHAAGAAAAIGDWQANGNDPTAIIVSQGPGPTCGLLTDPSGFPLMVSTFEENKAETTTIVPAIQAFL